MLVTCCSYVHLYKCINVKYFETRQKKTNRQTKIVCCQTCLLLCMSHQHNVWYDWGRFFASSWGRWAKETQGRDKGRQPFLVGHTAPVQQSISGLAPVYKCIYRAHHQNAFLYFFICYFFGLSPEDQHFDTVLQTQYIQRSCWAALQNHMMLLCSRRNALL